LGIAGGSGGEFFDGAEVAAIEQAAGDEIGEAEDRDPDAMAAGALRNSA